MCGIVDRNMRHQLTKPIDHAGGQFYDWLMRRRGKIVVGGSNFREEFYGKIEGDYRWLQELKRANAIVEICDKDVDRVESSLRNNGHVKSDDWHVLALAIVGKARLLFTNDTNLQEDFKNDKLINGPRGKVYSTREKQGQYDPKTHGGLLKNRRLCTAYSR